MPKDDQLSDSFAEFSTLLRSTREQKKWTQNELADHSHVAPRTIVNLESARERRKIRFDVVVRLAHALGAEVREWLALAGHKQVTEEQITQILKKYELSAFRGEDQPETFFKKLEERLASPSPILLLLCYRTSPSSAHQIFLQNQLAPLIDSGRLFAGLICPYPKIAKIEQAEKATLCNYYIQVYGEVIRLTKEIQNQVTNRKYKNHVSAFSLNVCQDNPVVLPDSGLSEFRPVFVQSFSMLPNKKKIPQYELSGWVSFLQEQRDRMIPIYPVPETWKHREENFLTICLAWKDYFSDVLDGCNFAPGGGWKKKSFGIWNVAV